MTAKLISEGLADFAWEPDLYGILRRHLRTSHVPVINVKDRPSKNTGISMYTQFAMSFLTRRRRRKLKWICFMTVRSTYRQCGMMKSVWGLQVNETDSDRDFCSMTCVTCDRKLAERIWDLHCRWCSMVDSYELSFINPNRGRYALIISHPHGKPKMITVGKALTEIEKLKYGDFCIEYQTATCPGSSGAPVFPIYPDPCYCRPASRYYRPRLVHSGTFDRPSTSPRCRVNYGHNWI